VICHPDNPAAALDAMFREVQDSRMADLPFLNPALRVEAVDFALWQSQWLGVLVTPWAMNLLLLPQAPEHWHGVPPGEIRRVLFPAGEFEFVAAADDRIGQWQSCSLFSPMSEFPDHETAVLVARAVRSALFMAEGGDDAPVPPPSQPPRLSRRNFLFGSPA
jgi:[NiFe] hydrogenase assembly HybE family chaperone